jgi:ADP-dependent phosphofructokinase/glucokinase
MSGSPRDVFLGLGDNVDFEVVWDGPRMQQRADQVGLSVRDLHHTGPIRSERELLGSISRHIHHSDGGEHHVVGGKLIKEFASGLEMRETLGGTAPRAACILAMFGIEGTLHLTTINDAVRRLLPTGFEYISSARSEHTYPHLIIQYPAGASITLADGTRVRAVEPNRLIYVNDEDNAQMGLSTALGELLTEARVAMLSGLNAVHERHILEARLKTLVEALAGRPAGQVVIFEDAAYHEPWMRPMVDAALGPASSIFSMNREEFLSRTGLDSLPSDFDELTRQLFCERARLGSENLVLHTSSWAMAVGPSAKHLGPALEQALTVGAARYRVGDSLTLEAVSETRNMPRAQEGLALAEWCLTREDVEARAGFLVDAENPTTIGLGDAFLGGLIAGIRNNNEEI